jgi:hypothetical protein
MHDRLSRPRKLKMWALTTLLHIAQPLARLRGRMRTPPWRPTKPPRAVVPWRRTAELWSEEWRGAEHRLEGVERAARAEGAPIFCGDTWDQWDLHLRAGLLGGARLRMGLEEHGGGRQLVRTRITPHVPAAALALVMGMLTVTVAAVVAHAWAAAALVGIVSTVLGVAVLWECGIATAWLDRHTGSVQA